MSGCKNTTRAGVQTCSRINSVPTCDYLPTLYLNKGVLILTEVAKHQDKPRSTSTLSLYTGSCACENWQLF